MNPKYYQNEIWSNTSVVYDKYLFLAQCCRLETSSYDFIKMTI